MNKRRIRSRIFLISAFLFFFGLVSLFAQKKKVELCVGYYQTEEEAIKQLERFASTYSNLKEWEKRAKRIRNGIIVGSELNKILKKYRKAPFETIIHSKKILDGYTVENIAIESKPGFYVTGNIYKPENIKGKIPVILCPHGHWSKPEDYGRFRTDMQKRCAAFARMGAVVFAYDMIGYGESTQYEHHDPRALQIQTFRSIRVLDYLLSLDYVDKSRVAVTGASGGATQTFLLTAVENRVTVSIPVVQVSAHFFGGCVCESGMPIHKSRKHETNNVEIAALAAPRPMLIISDGDDWTKNTPEVEFPYIKNIYKLYGVEDKVENLHLADEKHNYGFSKRKGVYQFLAKHLGLDYDKILNDRGEVDESFVTILQREKLNVFNDEHKRPESTQ